MAVRTFEFRKLICIIGIRYALCYYMFMITVYLGLGGNIGDSCCYIHKAVELLSKHPQIEDLQLSSLYRSEPVSTIEQRDFVNAVCVFQTSLSPYGLLDYSQEIERTLGKLPKLKEAPRIIDLDILLYGDMQIDTPELQIPHPYWKERLFVLLPLAELTSKVHLRKDQDVIEINISDLLAAQLQQQPHKIRLLLPQERIDTCNL
jgi:2-amino-4-hydroxy-6-hydroxymethyldihydropteridine diphosphokinase